MCHFSLLQMLGVAENNASLSSPPPRIWKSYNIGCSLTEALSPRILNASAHPIHHLRAPVKNTRTYFCVCVIDLTMFSGTLVVVLVVLLLCRRVLWHGLCMFIGEKWFKRPARTSGVANRYPPGEVTDGKAV